MGQFIPRTGVANERTSHCARAGDAWIGIAVLKGKCWLTATWFQGIVIAYGAYPDGNNRAGGYIVRLLVYGIALQALRESATITAFKAGGQHFFSVRACAVQNLSKNPNFRLRPPGPIGSEVLSEFGEPFDVELTGHGTVGLAWEEWRNCFNLAKAFGWQPAGTLAPADHTHWGGPPAFVGEWEGGYFSRDLQQVTHEDAKALALALQIAMLAWDRIEELTIQEFDALRRVPRSCDSHVTRVANFAASGGFLIF